MKLDDAYRFSVRDNTSFRISSTSSQSAGHNFEEFLVLITLSYDSELVEIIETQNALQFNYNHVVINGIEKTKTITSSGLMMAKVLAIDGKAYFSAFMDSDSNVSITYSNLSENLSIYQKNNKPDEVLIEGGGSFTVTISAL